MVTIKNLSILAILCAGAANAQHISIGALGGAPFADVITATTTSTGGAYLPKSVNLVIGPALQVDLPANFRIEADALYRPYSFSLTNPFASTTTSAAQFRFPIQLQYRLGSHAIKPFVGGGLSFDHLANISAAAKAITSGPGQLLKQSNAGFVLGGGIDAKIPFLRISGELRFTRQTAAEFRDISKLNQAEFLLGVHF